MCYVEKTVTEQNTSYTLVFSIRQLLRPECSSAAIVAAHPSDHGTYGIFFGGTLIPVLGPASPAPPPSLQIMNIYDRKGI